MNDYIITFRFAGDQSERKAVVSSNNGENAWDKLVNMYGNETKGYMPLLVDIRKVGIQ